MAMDLMFVDPATFSAIFRDGSKMNISGHAFTVPSLEHLIALKLHTIKSNPGHRDLKDFPDVINLLTINQVDVRAGKFRDLCLKYGTQELYSRILERFNEPSV